jgi:hypothetical protein
MVENIRSYYDVLCRFEAPHDSPYPASIQAALIFSMRRPSRAAAPSGTVMLPSSFW